jgi:hypothetical protein
MRALARERSARYASVDAFLGDLKRYLTRAGRAKMSDAEPSGYRLGLALSMLLLGLIAGAAVLWSLYHA